MLKLIIKAAVMSLFASGLVVAGVVLVHETTSIRIPLGVIGGLLIGVSGGIAGKLSNDYRKNQESGKRKASKRSLD